MRTFHFLLLCAIGILSPLNRAEAGVLYAATASGSAGELYIISQTTGAMIQDIGPLNDDAGTNYPITGLAFHPTTGVLYGSTGNNPAETAGLFVSINPSNAEVTVIGPFNAGPTNTAGTPATMADIGFDSAGNLYGVGSIGGPQLYSINVGTGQATVIGNTGLTSTTGGGLAVSPGGTIFGTPTASRFGTYDLAGNYTDITNPVKPGGGGAYAALDFDGAVLYGLNSAPGSPPPTFLATIDAAGNVTAIGQSVNSLDAIAFRIPEPAAIALWAIGMAVIAAWRRR